MSRSMKLAMAAFLALALVVPAAAQEDPQFSGRAWGPEAGQGEEQGFGAYGASIQDLWIAATEFNGKLSNQADLNYSSFHYYSAPSSATPVRYFAQIPLPSGAQITGITCHVRDTVANDVTLNIQKYSHNVVTNAPTTAFVRVWSSTGTTGYQQPSIVISAADGAVRYTVGNERHLYYLSADVASDTSLRGCNVQWRRTVSPGPGTASFPNDVPTSSGLFPFVEAMAASGLTGGCGPGSFCPNDPITRGQAAVFFAVALGLHFPQ